MTFILLDPNKSLAYKDGNILSLKDINNDKTWDFHPLLEEKNIEYGYILAEGKEIFSICPDKLKSIYEYYDNKIKSFLLAATVSKINVKEHSIFDLVPLQLIKDFCNIKCLIIDEYFQIKKKQENYDFLLDLLKLTTKIGNDRLNLDLSYLKSLFHESRARDISKIVSDENRQTIKYNIFGSKTGRLTTTKISFPILTLDKKYRSIIKPKLDFFLELDIQAAEIRVLYSLADLEQPRGDFHKWNASRLGISREDAKKKVFSFLYGHKEDNIIDDFKNVENKLREKYYRNGVVYTPYGRKIEADEEHWLNYLIQSTTTDLVLRQVLKVAKYLDKLEHLKIGFIIHDALILDVDSTGLDCYREVTNIFSNSELGIYPINLSLGEDLRQNEKSGEIDADTRQRSNNRKSKLFIIRND